MREEVRRNLERDRVEMLYEGLPAGLATTLVVMMAYAAVLLTEAPELPIFIWLALLTALLTARLLVLFAYRRNPDDTERWLRIHRLSVLATGLLIGASPVFTFPELSITYEIFAVFVLSGLCAGAMVVMAPDHVSFSLYASAILLPSAVLLLQYHDSLRLVIGLMVVIYLFTLIHSSRKVTGRVLQSLALGHENLALLEEMAREKDRLESRLGRLLSDETTEIFVYDAERLRCIQVNRGALRNLGYTEREMLGRHLLEIVSGLEREEFEELIRPIREGKQDSVVYRTEHRRKDGSRYPVEIRFQYSAREIPPVIVATALDVSQQDIARNRLFHKANFDHLTDLPNRFYMTAMVRRALARAGRHGKKVALLMLDLDNFKQINDALGHGIGDRFLIRVSERLQEAMGDNGTLARFGGDEFMIMLEDLESADQAQGTASALIHAFQAPFRVDGHELFSSLSIGISLYPDDAQEIEKLMLYADMAMYQAKQRGRNRHESFCPRLLTDQERRLKMEQALRLAVENGELSLLYQPKVDATTGQVVGAEALLRWEHPVLGRVPPDEFVPLAEKIGMIGAMGRWVLEQACRDAVTWPAADGVRVAVNVSPAQFLTGRLFGDVEHALQASGLPVERLELEITESLFVHDTSSLHNCLEQLRRRNIHLALDDFGTGYSALAYLQQFPLHTLKIDRCFVSDMARSENARKLVEAIISMARALDLEIVAEGVENDEQLAMLKARGVHVIQGYYYSPPLPVDEFRAMLAASRTGAEQARLASGA